VAKAPITAAAGPAGTAIVPPTRTVPPAKKREMSIAHFIPGEKKQTTIVVVRYNKFRL
jgi:hypothetical protein